MFSHFRHRTSKKQRMNRLKEMMEEFILQQFAPSSSSTSDPEAPVEADHQHHQPPQPADDGITVAAHNDVEWAAKVIGFCLSIWAIAIALQWFQIDHASLPISFHFLSHAIAIAVTLLFLSKYMYPKSPKLAQGLEDVGVLFAVTAFFIAITTPFPLYIKLIYWTIYALALALLAIFLCKCPSMFRGGQV